MSTAPLKLVGIDSVGNRPTSLRRRLSTAPLKLEVLWLTSALTTPSLRRRLSTAPLKRRCVVLAYPSYSAALRRRLSTAPLKLAEPALRQRHQEALRRRLSTAPLKPTCYARCAPLAWPLRRRLSTAPLKHRHRVGALVVRRDSPSTLVDGPIEALVSWADILSEDTTLRRRLSTAPLKHRQVLARPRAAAGLSVDACRRRPVPEVDRADRAENRRHAALIGGEGRRCDRSAGGRPWAEGGRRNSGGAPVGALSKGLSSFQCRGYAARRK